METGTNTVLQKILEKTEQQGDCLIWTGRIQSGVPFLSIRVQGQKPLHLTIRRYFYEQNTGEKLHRQAKLSMSCGNPLCVNPDHIVRGAGIGTNNGNQKNEVLKQYEALRQRTITPKTLTWYATQLGVSYPTLKRYVAEYAKQPKYWHYLWSNE